MTRKVPQHGRIDKSALTFGEPVRIRDRQYLDSIQGSTCWACGAPGAIGAHMRWGNEGGTALKPSDDLVCPLCNDCHMKQEDNPGPEWWVEHVLKPILRRAYLRFKDGH